MAAALDTARIGKVVMIKSYYSLYVSAFDAVAFGV